MRQEAMYRVSVPQPPESCTRCGCRLDGRVGGPFEFLATPTLTEDGWLCALCCQEASSGHDPSKMPEEWRRRAALYRECKGVAETELKKYLGNRGAGRFRAMTLEEAKRLGYGQRVWFLARQGDAREAKVNGAPKTWKRSPGRVLVPLKYGMYECFRFTERDVAGGRLLVEVEAQGTAG